jgi:PKD repeat protein
VGGVFRTTLLALGLIFAWALPASAAPTWLAPINLSTAPTAGSPSASQVASDAVGETFASWLRNDGTNDRVQIAGHGPGGPWSPAVDLSDATQNAMTPSLSLSSTGFGAIAWSRSDGSKFRIQVSRRAPGGAFGAATTLSTAGVDSTNPVAAVDAAGDVVVIWEDSTLLAVHARRFSASAGSWGPIEDLASSGAGQPYRSLVLVISAGGTATAAWALDFNNDPTLTQYQIQTRTAAMGGAWTPITQPSSTFGTDQSGAPQLAVDDAGNVTLVWFDYSLGSCGTNCIQYVTGAVRETTRPAVSGVWQTALTLSDPNLISDSPRVATTPAGEVTVVWTEQVSQSIKALTRPIGGTFPPFGSATIIVPQDRQISSSGAHGPVPETTLRIVAGAADTVVAFARYEDGSNASAEAVFKPAGAAWPNPATNPPTVLSPLGVNIGTSDGPSLALDGLGNAVASWTADTVIQAAAFDVSPPAFTAVNVPAAGVTNQPVALSASTLDTWSALAAGQPSWNFGDGNLGAGASLTHIFTRPGTYTVTVAASDALGNASAPVTRQIAISSPAGPPPPTVPATTIAAPKLKATYKASRLVGTIVLSGTSPINTTLTIAIRKRGAKKNSLSSSFAAKAGKWTRTLKLPTGLTPGKYDVTVSGKGVTSSRTSFALAAPKSGIVKRSYATGPKHGPATTTLSHTSELWAHFTFGTLPKKGQTITTQWVLPNGTKLAANTRPRTSLVEAQVKDLSGKALPIGRWRCVIRAGGSVVATLNVRLK